MIRRADQLLPHLPLLINQLSGRPDSERRLIIARQLEKLPHALSAAWYAFSQFIAAQNALVPQGRRHVPFRPLVWTLDPQEHDQMSFFLDSFLDAARRTQNAVIPYLAQALSLSLPKSLSDLVKKLEAGKTCLPEEVKSLLIGYWVTNGRRLKD